MSEENPVFTASNGMVVRLSDSGGDVVFIGRDQPRRIVTVEELTALGEYFAAERDRELGRSCGPLGGRSMITPVISISHDDSGQWDVSANPDLDAKYIVQALRDVATKINRLIKQYEEAR